MTLDIPLNPNGNGLAIWSSVESEYADGSGRSVFKHDADEIVYSNAFRRLAEKTQLVVKPKRYDLFRSRLTHTIEVRQIAQSIGLQLKLNSQLIDAIALGHDLGHSPFGHAGEKQLQQILVKNVSNLCEKTKLDDNYHTKYGISITKTTNDYQDNLHWIYHHGLNSVRILERKMKDISEDTRDGIMKHNWSPWKLPNDPSIFGIPTTYEAQAAAIADQVAGINHDIEDIINCDESEYKGLHKKLRTDMYGYIRNSIVGMPNKIIKGYLKEWFLPTTTDGTPTKKRLQKIIMSIVEATIVNFDTNNVNSPNNASDPTKTIKIENNIGNFLLGCENFIREKILKSIPWFQMRDTIAKSVISVVYDYYKYFAKIYIKKDRVKIPPDRKLDSKIQDRLHNFILSYTTGNEYSQDSFYQIYLRSAKNQSEIELIQNFHIIDYVSGMSDNFLMEIYKEAYQLFEQR